MLPLAETKALVNAALWGIVTQSEGRVTHIGVSYNQADGGTHSLLTLMHGSDGECIIKRVCIEEVIICEFRGNTKR